MKENWGWLGPLLIAVLIGFGQLYGLLGRVTDIEISQRTRGEKAIEHINNIENRLTIVERYCCEDELK